MRTIIIGPQGCGKSLHAEAIAAKEHPARIVLHEWDGRAALPSDCIATTSLQRDECSIPKGAEVVVFNRPPSPSARPVRRGA